MCCTRAQVRRLRRARRELMARRSNSTSASGRHAASCKERAREAPQPRLTFTRAEGNRSCRVSGFAAKACGTIAHSSFHSRTRVCHSQCRLQRQADPKHGRHQRLKTYSTQPLLGAIPGAASVRNLRPNMRIEVGYGRDSDVKKLDLQNATWSRAEMGI